jgi:hypothetical protein
MKPERTGPVDHGDPPNIRSATDSRNHDTRCPSGAYQSGASGHSKPGSGYVHVGWSSESHTQHSVSFPDLMARHFPQTLARVGLQDVSAAAVSARPYDRNPGILTPSSRRRSERDPSSLIPAFERGGISTRRRQQLRLFSCKERRSPILGSCARASLESRDDPAFGCRWREPGQRLCYISMGERRQPVSNLESTDRARINLHCYWKSSSVDYMLREMSRRDRRFARAQWAVAETIMRGRCSRFFKETVARRHACMWVFSLLPKVGLPRPRLRAGVLGPVFSRQSQEAIR